MAVVVLYMSTRDGKLFKDRREANAHDKMLEAVELLQELIAASGVEGIDEETADALAFYLVGEKDRTVGALKLVSSAATADAAVGEAPEAAQAEKEAEAAAEHADGAADEAADDDAGEDEFDLSPAPKKASASKKKKRGRTRS